MRVLDRLSEWYEAIHAPIFGWVTVLVLVNGVVWGALSIGDRAHYLGEARSCQRRADSIENVLTHGRPVTMPDGTIAWVARDRDTAHDTVARPFKPRRGP